MNTLLKDNTTNFIEEIDEDDTVHLYDIREYPVAYCGKDISNDPDAESNESNICKDCAWIDMLDSMGLDTSL